ncbi:MAG: 5-bromo-4-chloroindolyl phosphate hydrolysis family protein [Peptoniphilus sp.]|nr:5-bromo-4-chloroindolyl phosphate hydrolysis family protein [Peptoniphilus sp.]MDD7362889.1 5-bromo-4-chloroindolyl phosphate hydrolysis family protein [Bacillota bacterium]MDY6044870.1 5-bromo-4-chloroindolyl phosphate hydrolysis family protein [Peptoniphilus sp.]
MKDKNNLIDQINRAKDSDDFKDISDTIAESVESAISFTRAGIGSLMEGVKNGFNKEPKKLTVNHDPSKVSQDVTSPNTWFWLRNTAALGTIGSLCFSIIYFFSGLSTGLSNMLAAVFFFLVAGALLALGTFRAHKNMILARDFFRIRREIGNDLVLSTADIVTALAKPKSEVLAELHEMIRKDYLPQGRIVENGELLLLDKTAYSAYKKHYLEGGVHIEETPRHIEDNKEAARIDDDRVDALARYTETLKRQLEKTSSEELRAKIQRLQKIVDSIDYAVNNDPERVDALNKFVDYYAPTTAKLIERYLEFESSSVITESIRSTMKEIMKSLDTVTDAYEKLLDTLYKDDLLELQAEMNVMQTVLKQDGLFEQDSKGDAFDE